MALISRPSPSLLAQFCESASNFADLGGTVLPGSPADFGRLIAGETEKWGKVIRAVCGSAPVTTKRKELHEPPRMRWATYDRLLRKLMAAEGVADERFLLLASKLGAS